jgi:imidazole glycerol phosphate synthase subunit HisF
MEETKQSIAMKQKLNAGNTNTIENNITAHAGGTQDAALALNATKTIHVVSTVDTAADSIKLPLAVGSGVQHLVHNSSATSLQLFGDGTDTINDVAVSTGVAIAAGKSRLLTDVAVGKWISLLGA